uniref:Secreted protein n=1 Tax=Romanomermis culicivorax TaxID=13658 RepID=A0A915KZM8_ROMCU
MTGGLRANLLAAAVVVATINSLNVGNFGPLREWCILRICHPAVDQTHGRVVGLQQARRVIQATRFIEKKG